jgi:hypothetical protein
MLLALLEYPARDEPAIYLVWTRSIATFKRRQQARIFCQCRPLPSNRSTGAVKSHSGRIFRAGKYRNSRRSGNSYRGTKENFLTTRLFLQLFEKLVEL